MDNQTRREFLCRSATLTGSIFLLPVITSCSKKTADPAHVPLVRPSLWDSVAFNRTRGNAGAIPESYLDDINGPDGEKDHIGKHLPYIPVTDPKNIPNGYIPIMWGDPSKGHTPHPNAPPNESNNHEGHWYNRIKIRKATKWYAQTTVSTYSDWPCIGDSDTGAYLPWKGTHITEGSGANTVYLARLPKDISIGDTVRIWAHCLTHGEYIDFLVIPNLKTRYFV